MSLYNKIKKLSKTFTEKAKNYSADELIADSIIKAAKKKDKVNVILREKGSLYRINHIDLDIDLPPNVRFGVGLLSKERTQPTQEKSEALLAKEETEIISESEI